jgi:hypothetical protein
MLHRLCLGLTLPLLVGAAGGQNLPDGWSVFTSKEGRFAIALPGTPEQSKQRVKTAGAFFDVHLFVLETKVGNYVVSYCDMPTDEVKPGSELKRLELAQQGAVDNAKGTLRNRKERKLDSYPGRELDIEAAKGQRIRLWIVAVERRLYQAMVMGPAKVTESADAGRFLDSLKLVK